MTTSRPYGFTRGELAAVLCILAVVAWGVVRFILPSCGPCEVCARVNAKGGLNMAHQANAYLAVLQSCNPFTIEPGPAAWDPDKRVLHIPLTPVAKSAHEILAVAPRIARSAQGAEVAIHLSDLPEEFTQPGVLLYTYSGSGLPTILPSR